MDARRKAETEDATVRGVAKRATTRHVSRALDATPHGMLCHDASSAGSDTERVERGEEAREACLIRAVDPHADGRIRRQSTRCDHVLLGVHRYSHHSVGMPLEFLVHVFKSVRTIGQSCAVEPGRTGTFLPSLRASECFVRWPTTQT